MSILFSNFATRKEIDNTPLTNLRPPTDGLNGKRMTQEKLQMAKWMLENGHPCNTSEDYSLSIKKEWEDDYSICIYPADGLKWWTEIKMAHVISIRNALNLTLLIRAINEIPVFVLR